MMFVIYLREEKLNRALSKFSGIFLKFGLTVKIFVNLQTPNFMSYKEIPFVYCYWLKRGSFEMIKY